MSNSLEKIYDVFAKTYEVNRGVFDITEILNSFFTGIDEKEGKLLDLGCGAGEPVARFFIDRRWNVTGVDFSERMLELASEYVPEMLTIKADMAEVEFEPNCFNAITATYSLFHVSADIHFELFKKLYYWLRPNGKMLFTYATEEYTGSKEFDGYKKFMDQDLYYSHKAPNKLYEDLEEIGFNVESAEYRCIGNETFLWVTTSKPAQKLG